VKDIFVKDCKDRSEINNTIKLIQKLSSTYIVKFYDPEDSAQNIYIVMEYCRGGSLQEFIDNRPSNRPLDEVV
jgi:serine/threonine protein kinase